MYKLYRIWVFLHIMLHIFTSSCQSLWSHIFLYLKPVARDKHAQALEPVVGNFDTLGEATSEEKAPLWWEKPTLAVVDLVDYSLIRICLAKSVHLVSLSLFNNQEAAIDFVFL